MKPTHSRQASGFTLIEMSIVLVIIGLIVAAVSIGINLQRSAEHTLIKQKFVDQWVVAYNEYYKRTGTVIGDDQTQPTLMVAGLDYGFEYDSTQGTGLPDSNDASGVIAVDRSNLYLICEGEGHAFTPIESGTFQYSPQRLHELMDRHGIRMPPGRANGQEDRYAYLDNNGNPQEVQICFTWFPAESAHGSGNAMVIRGLTPDLARQLDRMIDGNADALEGRFRQLYTSAALHNGDGPHQQANREWTGVNSRNLLAGDSLDAGDIAQTGSSQRAGFGASQFNDAGYSMQAGVQTGTIRDEDQVMRVTAVYLMDW
jgi:prepilin-type N-terminal cleavage/methylation domain-containing protein